MSSLLEKLLTNIFGTSVTSAKKGGPTKQYTEGGLFGGSKPTITDTYNTQTPTVTPTPTSTPTGLKDLQQRIYDGLHKYSSSAPIATMAAPLAQAGSKLPDPLLPVLVALIESSGGRNITRGTNNMYNVNAPSGGVNYPDLKTAILGGQGHQGFVGTVLNSGIYNDYLKSGKLEDFLKHYTPAGAENGNASMDRQLHRYNDLRSLFQ